LKFKALFTSLLLLYSFSCFSQLVLKQQNAYVPGVNMLKVMACLEDHTVIAVSETGKVYCKRASDNNFQIYGPASGLKAVDAVGFNYNEIYVLVQPDLIYYFKNGVRNEIKVLNSGVTKIHNIGVVNDVRSLKMDYYEEDWLAIATDNGLYPLFRNSTTAGVKYQDPYVSRPNPNAGVRLTNSSFKFLDIQFEYPDYQRCYKTVNYVYFNHVGGVSVDNILPEEPPFSAKVNCTLFELDFDQLGFEYYKSYCLWGSNDGIFAKNYLTCHVPFQIFDKPVNDLEEIDLLFHLLDEKFILAGSDEGLYYSKGPLRAKFASIEPQDLKFLRFGANEKINSISSEIYLPDGNAEGQNSQSYCEKVVWLATASGIKELSVEVKDEYYQQLPLTDFFSFNVPEGVSQPSSDSFVLCNGQTFQVDLLNSGQLLGRIFINWFKDGLAVPEWAGKATIEVGEKGVYHCELTAICENIILTTKSFTVAESASPQFSFPYPAEVKICENQSFPMETTLHENYEYRWYKNDERVEGATHNKYTAVTSGIYRVEVSSCAGSFVSSSNVNVLIDALTVPLILSDKLTYCSSDLAMLSVENPSSNNVRWYFNGAELVNAVGVTKLQATESGQYQVEFMGGAGCSKRSEPYELILHSISAPLITMSTNKTLYYGETVKLSIPTEPGASYLWNTMQTGSSIDVTKSGRYFVEMVNQYGCKVKSAEVTVEISDKISVPNTFSPNGDGINDYWIISGLESDSKAQLAIFNRYGQVLFTGTGKQPVWDGKYKGSDVPIGVYYYRLKHTIKGVKDSSGTITLIR
jgi:gliding motility-associated-like protein